MIDQIIVKPISNPVIPAKAGMTALWQGAVWYPQAAQSAD
jgi:hypothetical protein